MHTPAVIFKWTLFEKINRIKKFGLKTNTHHLRETTKKIS